MSFFSRKKKEATNPDAPKKKKVKSEFHVFGVSQIAVAMSIRHLCLMLKSGLALGEAVEVLADKSTDDRLQVAYTDIYEGIQGGQGLSDSMAKHPKIFSDIVVSIVKIGEQGGTLEKNLEFLSEYLKKGHELTKKVKGALIYPGIIFTMTVAEMLAMMLFILPKLEQLFSTFSNIPPFTKAVLALSKFVRDNGILIIIAGVLVYLLWFLFARTETGKYFKDWLALHFPVVKNLTRNNVLATFSRTVGILLETGIPISKAMEIASDTIGNRLYKKVLIKVAADIKSGKNLADCLEEYPQFFPSTFGKMIEIGEKTGALEANLYYLYEFHASEVEDISTNLTTLLEPILLIFIGSMIGMLALIIVGPIYQFTSNING